MKHAIPSFVSVQTALHEAARFLASVEVPSPQLEAEVLLAYCLKLDRIALYRHPERELKKAEFTEYQDVLRRRAEGIPTAYLRGIKEFFSLPFRVGPGVLIPRADSEIVVEEALKLFPKDAEISMLDIGTGSGALIVAILRYYRNGHGIATDCSEKALEYANDNAKRHKVQDRVRLAKGDLIVPLNPQEKFDLIVSNPPYIPTGEISSDLRFEPREAFDGGEDGLTYYRKILADAWTFLKSGGFLLLEVGNVDSISTLSLSHYVVSGVKKDLAGRDRVLVLQHE